MKRGKKILRAAVCVLLSLILLFLIAFFWHFPRYLRKKERISVEPAGERITMMSYNLRCLTPLDLGEKSWYYRADRIAQDIAEYAPGIIGFQEATKWQYAYFVDVLAGYDSVIEYRDTSVIAEGCPIFFNTKLYTLVEKGSFWLSETPDVMSKDWGAAHYRICSYAILQDQASGKNFVVFNTHLDHVSDEARINGIGVVLQKIAEFGGLPAVIMGDLNAKEGSQTYKSVTENFLDARYAAAETVDSHTYQNWGNSDAYKRIDYFMISREGFRAEEYGVLSGMRDGIYTSDHCAIYLKLTLQ